MNGTLCWDKCTILSAVDVEQVPCISEARCFFYIFIFIPLCSTILSNKITIHRNSVHNRVYIWILDSLFLRWCWIEQSKRAKWNSKNKAEAEKKPSCIYILQSRQFDSKKERKKASTSNLILKFCLGNSIFSEQIIFTCNEKRRWAGFRPPRLLLMCGLSCLSVLFFSTSSCVYSLRTRNNWWWNGTKKKKRGQKLIRWLMNQKDARAPSLWSPRALYVRKICENRITNGKPF